jgi:hypothetical protein
MASAASLHADNVDSITIPDSGSYSLAAGSLKAEKAVAKENLLRLTRTNTVAPAGAVAGSTWSVSISNEINVVAAPLP